MQIIQLIGRNRVGKTTLSRALAKFMTEHLNLNVVELSFADALRHELISLYGIPKDLVMNKMIDKNTYMLRLGDYSYDKRLEQLWIDFKFIKDANEYPDLRISLRELLMTHATRIRRVQDKNYWANLTKSKIADMLIDGVEFVVIDDARYANELDFSEDLQTVFYLENYANMDYTDIAQESIVEWHSKNASKTIGIRTPVPLTEFESQLIVINELVPMIRIPDLYLNQTETPYHEESNINTST